MKRLDVLVVDDEPFARAAVACELLARAEVAQVFEVDSGIDAIPHIERGGIDLVYLDITMPGLTGIDVARQLRDQPMPPVIFVTAYDRFAVAAFEVRAIDYLMKPFSSQRFDESFRRALRWVEIDRRERSAAAQPTRPSGAGSDRFARNRLRIKSTAGTTIVALDDVVWIEAANAYVRVHTRDETHLLRGSLNAMERELDPMGLVRVHRSAIVNLSAVVKIHPVVRGDYEILLSNDDRVRASRRRRRVLFDRLQQRTL